MSTREMPVSAILAAGVELGFAGDYLLRAPGEPGLNFAVLFAGVAASVAIVSLSGGPRLSGEARAWLLAGAVLGLGLVWRGSFVLRPLALLGACLAFTLPAYRAGRAWVARAGALDVAQAAAASGLHAAFGSARLLHGDAWRSVGSDEARGAALTTVRTVVAGAALAVVPLLVFGSLFVNADPVFARILGDFARVDLEVLASHVVVTGILSWLACGYLAGFATGTRIETVDEMARGFRPSLRTPEVAVALGLVDLLFLGFVTVQFRYLFGGHEMVEVTPGLTYAAYAREGFFQLVAATALGLPWLLAVDSLHEGREGRGRAVYRGLAGAQLVLLLAVVASAVQRMGAYLDAYGLTEDRIVALSVLGWAALLVGWFGATVLRGRRTTFVPGALVSGLALVALLQVMNPAGRAARSHLDRPGSVDVEYLATLGSDATPVLVEHLDALPPVGRCVVARALLDRWGPERETDWRSWNLADARAREVVATRKARLTAMAGGEGDCR